MMPSAPKSLRLHIALVGRRNVGKSSLLNALTRQAVAIVSPTPGTTTDVVEKAMELQPLGPVLWLDTAGVDDEGELGRQRVAKTHKALDRSEVALLVAGPAGWGVVETELVQELKRRAIPFVIALNQADQNWIAPELAAQLSEHKVPVCAVSALTGAGLEALRTALIAVTPDAVLNHPPLLSDLVRPGELVVLVVPIDKEAPAGRLILPQVQTIRALLDQEAISLVVRERELAHALAALKTPPALVITDSQAFLKVAADTPPAIPLTSFSILFARLQGDLTEFVRGAMHIERLRPGDRILIAEACTHHPIGEDIGRVKIPRWLRQYVGGDLDVQVCQGQDFPADLSSYQLVIHCGSCMLNRRAVLNRIQRCRAAQVPITNYGLAIAYTLGIFQRALQPFPAARSLVQA